MPTDHGCNLGYLCSTRHRLEGNGDRTAFRWVDNGGRTTYYSYTDLDTNSNSCAEAFSVIGLGAGDVLSVLLPKCPDLFFAFVGALKHRLVVNPLFSNFGEDALLERLSDAGTRAVLARKRSVGRLRNIMPRLPELRYILVTDIQEHVDETVLSLPQLLRATTGNHTVGHTEPETPSLLHYTSGSTGKPKGVVHVHGAGVQQEYTARTVLDLHPGDTYWCTADQAWVTGTSYGILGPWLVGCTQVHIEGGFNAKEWFRVLQDEGVTVWYTAPTAIRMLMREPDPFFGGFGLDNLRHICSVGEPLNPEAVHWGRRVLGKDIHDTWFQTETGAIMIANSPSFPIKPGSMGKPIDMVEAAILGDDGTPCAPGEVGNLCAKAGWPSMFRAYRNNPDTYAAKFKEGYYFTGDLAYRDDEGYFWFIGRADDVINTAGHLVGPFEIESALLELPEVAEAAAIGAPDETLFEKVVCYVSLREGVEFTRELEVRIRLHVSGRVSSIATPQEVIVSDDLPKNKSGKIMRRVLKKLYMGEDPGDTSTMEVV